MATRLRKRLFVFALLLVAAFFGLGYRLVDLQVIQHERLKKLAEQNTRRGILLEPRRGDILDCTGNVLATTHFVKTVCGDPEQLGTNYALVASALAPVLNVPESTLAEKLRPRTIAYEGRTIPVRYVELKKRIPIAEWIRISEVMTKLNFGVDEQRLTKTHRNYYRYVRKGIFARELQMRHYPNRTLAAHVLGFTGFEQRMINDTPVIEMVGRDGVEATFESKLSGVRGWRVSEYDVDRDEMVTLRQQDVQPRNGFDVVLTIDSVLQHILENALQEGMEKHSPISISGLVVRPETGKILAMATLPGFDPNLPKDMTRNRVLTDQIEPGSTFKIVPVSAALNEGVVRLSDQFDCEHGRFYFGGRVLHDHGSYGVLSVEGIITKSSNIGAAKVGIRLGEERLEQYVRRFGFGSRTGIPLLGEVPGVVHPVKRWSKVTIAQIPMGHGVAVTPLQMTMAMCAIANGGTLMQPMLVERVQDRERGEVVQYEPQPIRRVVSEEAARMMTTALKTVVSTNGTAPKAALQHYTVAGKTGTAQKVENGTYVRKYISSFIGFFPADAPELCVAFFIDEPKNSYYGGQTAAPMFKKVAELAGGYLNIRPDRPVESEASALAATTSLR